MSRPFKCRRIANVPGITYFKPAGIPLDNLEEVTLSLEEAEALRLKELEGLEQEQGAEKMNVSRPTFQRILASARVKSADAILNGKAIRIEGGNFELARNRYRCRGGHEWEVSGIIVAPAVCPECDNTEIQPVLSAGYGCGRGGHGRHGGRR
ncbi:MAG TPA: hypothetical protein DCR59_00855 [Dehalococcoidia bacterium]|nr:hypothetical protein [Dehalococcoidia bacterium]